MKKTNPFLAFLREITIVVIGVVIAVSLGNYKEKLDNKKYVQKTMLAIEQEIISSQTEIDSVLVRHLKLYEKLEQLDSGSLTIGEFVSGSGGFQVASIVNISLRFFVTNKAELLEFELISQLLEIELKTSLLADKIEHFASFAYDNVNESDDKAYIKFGYLLADIIEGEQSLLAAYDDFLAEHERTFQ